MYINVTDKRGATIGYDSTEYVPLTHRLLFEKGQVFGADNLVRRLSKAEWTMFMSLVVTLPTGSYGDFTWERE